MSLDTFEQSLLDELRQYVDDRSAATNTIRRRRRLGLVGGIAAAAACAAAVVIVPGVSGPGTTAAYAVEPQSDGDVVVTVHDLADAAGFEQALAAHGVHADVTFVRDFRQVDASTGAGPADCPIVLTKVADGLRFTLGAAQITAGATLDVVTSGSSPDEVGSPVAVSWTGGGC